MKRSTATGAALLAGVAAAGAWLWLRPAPASEPDEPDESEPAAALDHLPAPSAAPVPAAVAPPPAPPLPAPETPVVDAVAWLKGNLHTHTSYSADSGTQPRDVVRWYDDAGYDFIVLTDHNHVTRAPGTGRLLVIPGVELTHKTPTCEPPPPDPDQDCRIHVNALFVAGEREGKIKWDPGDVVARADKYQRAFDAAAGLGAVVQINHPNWYWGMTTELVTDLGRRGALLLEISNRQFAVWDRGRPGKYPSTEELWDAALGAGLTMWGVAVDDGHNYWDVARRRARGLDEGYPAGGAFVMVRARRSVAAIRRAIERGQFYSSTGILLERAGRAGDHYEVVVADGFPPYTFTFIGTGGEPLRSVRDDRSARFPLASVPPGYLRVNVEDRYGQRAWTQPIRPSR